MSELEPIRVMIVDDHQMVRDGLKVFLSVYDDLVVVAEASDGKEALDLCPKAQPDVVLMDIIMPVVDGPTATKQIRQQFPEIQVIALTSFVEDALVQRALQSGAISYLLKDVNADHLTQAIRDAHIGRGIIDSEAAQALVNFSVDTPNSDIGLTPREREILVLLVDGNTNNQIAENLTLSLGTVRFHVSNILSKLGVSNRTEAVSLALQQGLVK